MTHGRPQKPRATLRLEQKRVPGSCHGLACQRGRRQGRPGVHRSSVLPRPRLILPLRSQVCSTFLLLELPGNRNDSWASRGGAHGGAHTRDEGGVRRARHSCPRPLPALPLSIAPFRPSGRFALPGGGPGLQRSRFQPREGVAEGCPAGAAWHTDPCPDPRPQARSNGTSFAAAANHVGTRGDEAPSEAGWQAGRDLPIRTRHAALARTQSPCHGAPSPGTPLRPRKVPT